MAQMALLFLGFTLLVLLLFTVASIVYVPKVLSTGHGDDRNRTGTRPELSRHVHGAFGHAADDSLHSSSASSAATRPLSIAP